MENIEAQPTVTFLPDDLKQIEGENVRQGTAYVFGTPWHFTFVEVQDEKDGGWIAVNDPYNRLEDAERLYDYVYLPTQIDGKTYVGFAHPHGD